MGFSTYNTLVCSNKINLAKQKSILGQTYYLRLEILLQQK